MMTPAEIELHARAMQRNHRDEAAREALARRLAPGPFDRLRAALRPRPVAPEPTARPARPLAAPTAAR